MEGLIKVGNIWEFLPEVLRLLVLTEVEST